MSKVIYEVVNALEAIADHWIQFPIDVDSKQQIQLGFLEKFGFLGVLGAIDGTHVAILQPVQDEYIYFNRKRFHSKNVQIICDSNLVILNVNANFGGAGHDPFIWRNSMVYRHLKEYYRNNNRRSWLLGDSGYPLQPWLLIPINQQKSTRNCVERYIGR
ncbi:hypothetical protein MML48_9g00000305 [Holotrichia oblita]|uniref:Uncharacterized protein n=2 Tax=Holotrichia oblita TaxID=644536 RepID=A0ACB9SPS4_HOLOL|nr:hypothetical protein MML48_9g00002698 [Holotrichia oblita]KAI4455747.1 hypothetical protein MML48_9g00000305 [Holotrichia oblita]